MRFHLGFLCYGACALIVQLVCLQELLVLFAGLELFLGFSLAAWMIWVGLGSWVGRKRQELRLSVIVACSIPLLIANLIAIRLTKCLFGFGMLIGLLPMLLLTTLLLAPIGFVVGVLFTGGCARGAIRHSFSSGRAYLWDALGASFGGLIYSWLIAGHLSAEWIVVMVAVPAALVAASLASSPRSQRWIVLVATIGAALAFAASPIPRWTRQLQWRGYTLRAEQTSRYSHLALASIGHLTSLFENGVISAHFPDPPTYEELVHWPLLAHAAPRHILIIGGAATGSLAEILKHPVARVDVVELDPAVIRLLKPALPEQGRAALEDQRVRLIHQDGRRFLATTTDRYDVILLQLPEPLNAQINRLYTLEAFQAIRRHLAPSGLFAFTIPSSENYLAPEIAYFNASLYRTLHAVFPAVELVAGNPLLLLASVEEVPLDLERLTLRYHERRLTTTEVVPSYFPIKLDALRRAAVLRQLHARPGTSLNRDFVPVCYVATQRAWLAKFVSPMYFLSTLAFIALIAWLLRAAWRKRSLLVQRPVPVMLAALGFAGIVYETVLLLAFQALNGYVYWQLGSLFASFMLGLAIGSALTLRYLAKLAEDRARRWLRCLILITALEGCLLPWLLLILQHLPIQWAGVVPFGLLLLFTGAWVGAAFPVASLLSASLTEPQSAAGLLYAADLWGAALGACVTSALLVPLLGLPATAGFTGLALLAFLIPYARNPGSIEGTHSTAS